MNELWTTTVCTLLATAGTVAELNLLRIFVGDWRRGHREHRQQSFQARRATRAAKPTATRVLTWRRGLAACVLGTAVVSTAAFAQDAAATNSSTTIVALEEQAPVALTPVKSAFSVQLNLDCTSAYFYHGIVQEDTGFILQPAAKLTINVCEQDDLKVDAFIGMWNSLHGQRTAAQTQGDFTEYWYEADLVGGVAFTSGKFSLAAQYAVLTSPSDAYETVQELDFTVAYDDSEALAAWALHPYALLAIETGADASDGANSDPGTYLELGIAPGFSFDAGATPVTIAFPVSIGLSLADYYQNAAGDDDTFGFAQIGVKASVPLPFAERYGKWTLNAGVSALLLGDHMADVNAGQGEQFIGTVGLQLNF